MPDPLIASRSAKRHDPWPWRSTSVGDPYRRRKRNEDGGCPPLAIEPGARELSERTYTVQHDHVF
jgi:hypothetical protein